MDDAAFLAVDPHRIRFERLQAFFLAAVREALSLESVTSISLAFRWPIGNEELLDLPPGTVQVVIERR
jgi:hypothetical protein